MAVYVLSDIHGMYNTFMNMLKLIQFNDEDELYILGDIVDRGPDSYKVFEYVISNKNIHMIMGNHEKMLIDYVFKRDSNWLFNGGYKTIESIPYESLDEFDWRLKEMACYFRDLPYYYKLDIEGEKYLLVHAGIRYGIPIEHQKKEDLIWIREGFLEYDLEAPEGFILFGHTPNQLISSPPTNDPIICENRIAMDGGACFGGQLNCLRLDDKQFFRVFSNIEKK